MQSEAGIEERPDRRRPIIVGAIRLLAAVALGVSAYLAWQSITGRVPT